MLYVLSKKEASTHLQAFTRQEVLDFDLQALSKTKFDDQAYLVPLFTPNENSMFIICQAQGEVDENVFALKILLIRETFNIEQDY